MRLTADVRIPVEISVEARGATSHLMHSEHADAPPYTPPDQPQHWTVGGGASTELQDVAEVCMNQACSGPSSTSTRPAVQWRAKDVDIAVQDCLPYEHAGLDPSLELNGERSVSNPAVSSLRSPPRAQKRDRQDLPIGNPDSRVGSPNTPVEYSDESSLGKGVHAEQPQLHNGRGKDAVGPSASKVLAVIREGDSQGSIDEAVAAFHSDGPKTASDRASSISSAGACDTSEDDSDGPSIPIPRRQKRTRARSIEEATSASTPRPWSSPREVGRTKGGRCLKRLHRRRQIQCDSPPPGFYKAPDTSAASTSSGGTSERWPVQCFFQRKLVGSQEVITIEFPALHLYSSPHKIAAPPSPNGTARAAPVVVGCPGSRRRVRFSEEEEDLLIELKEQRQPRLSWNEIHRHFPSRTVGSLQVHYSKQLNGRSRPKLSAQGH